MTHPSAPPVSTGSGIPILGPLGRGARIGVLATVAIAVMAIVLEVVFHVEGTPLFLVSALGILGLAWVVGLATERLGAITGPQIGGILNATFGNIAELIIAFFALQAGLIRSSRRRSPARSSATCCSSWASRCWSAGCATGSSGSAG